MKRQVKIFCLLFSLLLILAMTTITVFADSPRQTSTTQADPLPIIEMILASGSIIWIVTGTVTYIKKLGVKGSWLTVSSMAIGIIFGGAYRYYVSPFQTFSDWFVAVIFGIALGLIASGVYDAYGKKTPEANELSIITPPSISTEDKTGTAR